MRKNNEKGSLVESVTWDELTERYTKHWNIERCVFEESKSPLGRHWTYKLRLLCVRVEDDQVFSITHTPFEKRTTLADNRLNPGKLKMVIAKCLQDHESIYVAGFQRVQIRRAI